MAGAFFVAEVSFVNVDKGRGFDTYLLQFLQTKYWSTHKVTTMVINGVVLTDIKLMPKGIYD